jgi:hypothetical protein
VECATEGDAALDATLDTAVGTEFNDVPEPPNIDLACAPELAGLTEAAGFDAGVADDPEDEDGAALLVGADDAPAAVDDDGAALLVAADDGLAADDDGDTLAGVTGAGVAAALGLVTGVEAAATGGGVPTVDSADAGVDSGTLPVVSGNVESVFGAAPSGPVSAWCESFCGDGVSVDGTGFGVGFEDDSSWADEPRSWFGCSATVSVRVGDPGCVAAASVVGDADGVAV